jgi:hypothetical protein
MERGACYHGAATCTPFVAACYLYTFRRGVLPVHLSSLRGARGHLQEGPRRLKLWVEVTSIQPPCGIAPHVALCHMWHCTALSVVNPSRDHLKTQFP